MFERFTKAARAVVLGGVRSARRQGEGPVTAQDLALALLEQEDTPAARVLGHYGVRRDEVAEAFRATRRRAGLSEAETAALSELGIDVDVVVARIEQSLGEGALASSSNRATRRRTLFGPRVHTRFTRGGEAGARRQPAGGAGPW